MQKRSLDLHSLRERKFPVIRGESTLLRQKSGTLKSPR